MKLGVLKTRKFTEILQAVTGYIPENRILKCLNNNLVSSDFVGMIDITEDGMLKFLQSKWDAKSVTADDKKWQITKPAVTLSKILKIDLSQRELTEFIEKFKMIIAQNKQTLEIVSDKDVIWSYLQSNSDGVKSCMSGNDASNKIAFYSNNNVKLVRVMQRGKVKARALLWENVEYRLGNETNYKTSSFVDRIYPEGGTAKEMILEYAKENKYLLQAKAREPLRIKVGGTEKICVIRYKLSTQHKDAYPYIDTLCFVNKDYASNLPFREGEFKFARATADAYTIKQMDEDFFSRLSNNAVESHSYDFIREWYDSLEE